MKKAIVFLANGFEEMEATGTVDILRRGGIDTKTVSITDDRWWVPIIWNIWQMPYFPKLIFQV